MGSVMKMRSEAFGVGLKWVVTALFCALCFFEGGACTLLYAQSPTAGSTLSADEAYLKARKHYGTGDFVQALEWLKYANRKEPRAIFVFNMARIQEAIGQLSEAYKTFLKVNARSDANEKIRGLCQAQAEALKPLLNKSVVRFKGLKPGTVVQIDDKMALDLSVDSELKPGSHQICFVEGGDGMRCWRRELAAGVRSVWPPETNSGTRGDLVWTGMKGVKELKLNGATLLVDLKKLQTINVDVGRHTLEVKEKGGATKSVTIAVLPGSSKLVLEEFGGGGEGQPTAPVAAKVEGDAGAMPWVVTGIGGAMVVGGAAMWAKSRSTRDDWTTQDEHKAAWDQANSEEQMGFILGGVGLAAVAGGLTWWSMSQEAKAAKTADGGPIYFGFSGIQAVHIGGRF